MKNVIAALFAGTLALSSLSALAADPAMDQPKAETKTEKAKDYVKEKAHNTKVKAKKAGKKVKRAVKERKTMDPASPNESKPDAVPAR